VALIKYQWLSFEAYLCFQNLKERLSDVLQNIDETNIPLEIILKEAAQKMNENLVRYEHLMA
jgi:hypothetical protein